MSDPNDWSGSTLLDKSTAKPTSINMAIFEPASKPVGQGTVSSDYQKRNLEEDPWPTDQNSKKISVTLSGCRFTTTPEQLAIEKPFEAECKAVWTGDTSPQGLRVTIVVKMTWNNDGKDQVEEGLNKLTGYMQGGLKDQVVTVKAELPRPPSFPPEGAKIQYQLVASHPEADTKAESDPLELVLMDDIHYLEMPDLYFVLGGHMPCLDPKGQLVDGLAAALRWSAQNPTEQLVVFGHADTSGDHPANYEISHRRAVAAMALLSHQGKFWEKLAQGAKVAEIQQCLSSLTAKYGWSCDPGAIDGQSGPKTKAAIKSFQAACNAKYKLGLAEDGDAGPQTWKAVHRVICGLVAKNLGVSDPASAAYPEWTVPEMAYPEGDDAFGCGESFPVKSVGVDGLKSAENRRVDILFCYGWNFLEPVADTSRALTLEECLPYDLGKMRWVAIPTQSGTGADIKTFYHSL